METPSPFFKLSNGRSLFDLLVSFSNLLIVIIHRCTGQDSNQFLIAVNFKFFLIAIYLKNNNNNFFSSPKIFEKYLNVDVETDPNGEN